MSPVVRAIDVGYGNTKFTTLVTGSDIQCGLFPSLAPQASTGPDLAAGLMQRRNTVVVEVEGVKYEVGKDARLAQDASHGRVLDPDYSMTAAHMALIRGAFYYMGQSKIDLLVLGLPVNTFEKYNQQLAERVIGNALAGAWVAVDHREATLLDLGVLDPPAEVLHPRRHINRLGRQFGGEGIPLQPVEGEEFLVHAGSLSAGGKYAGGRPVAA